MQPPPQHRTTNTAPLCDHHNKQRWRDDERQEGECVFKHTNVNKFQCAKK